MLDETTDPECFDGDGLKVTTARFYTGQHVAVRVGVHVEGVALGHDAKIRGLLAAANERRRHRLGVGVVHQQGGDHADLVGGGAPAGLTTWPRTPGMPGR